MMIYEIWLGEHYSYFNRGVAHSDNGQIMKLKALIHEADYGYHSVYITNDMEIDNNVFFILNGI